MPTRCRVVVAALCTLPLAAQTRFRAEPLPDAGADYRVSVALGDVDGDRIDDLLIGRNGSFAVRKGLAGPPQRRFAAVATPLPGAVGTSCENCGQGQLVDVDRDGDLDVLALDTPLGTGARVVWFANDGSGGFAEPVPLSVPPAALRAWNGQASTLVLHDHDGDRIADLLVAAEELMVHRGTGDGFAAEPIRLGVRCRTFAFGDHDGDGMVDLWTIEQDHVVVRRAVAGGFGDAVQLHRVAGDTGQARLQLADWNGDGRLDVLLGENLDEPIPPADPADEADARERLQIAERILAVLDAESARLNSSRPPLGDAAAMDRRLQRRAELGHWAAGPRAVRDELKARLQPRQNSVRGSITVLLRD